MRTEPSARFYELMAISVPDGLPEDLIATSESISGYVVAAGGRILRSSNESPWGRRRLAYPIRHESTDLRDGFYTLYHFELEPNRIEDIEREIRLNERIIRHLLLQLDSEPIFIEEDEDIITTTDPITGEIKVVEDIVVVAEAPASGVTEIVEDTEVVVVDAAGEVEAVAEEIEAETIVDGVEVEVEAVAEESEVEVVEAEEK